MRPMHLRAIGEIAPNEYPIQGEHCVRIPLSATSSILLQSIQANGRPRHPDGARSKWDQRRARQGAR